MASLELISIETFCAHHHVETRFIHLLQESGLVRLTVIDEGDFLDQEQLPLVEKWVTLYYEMDINVEGIETITHLLETIHDLQKEIRGLKNRLNLYEMND